MIINKKLKVIIKKIIGINIVISISKIKKINLIIKKWILKGGCEEDSGSNPHSNGDIFSRSWKVFFEIKKLINNKIIGKNKIIIDDKKIYIIIYIKMD